MKLLFDISHPAHAHFFRHAIHEFRAMGHETIIVSRDKDMTLGLLDEMGFTHTPLSTAPTAKGVAAFAREMAIHCARLLRVVRRERPDVLLQIGGTFIAPVGKLTGVPALVFYDTEFARLSNAISYPLSAAVCTPECYQGAAGRRHVRYPGYHELAYLHPNRFTPDPAVLAEAGISPEEKVFLLRFVGWTAHHDYGEEGFGSRAKCQLVHDLAELGRVIITSEAALPDELESYRSRLPVSRIHDLMAFSTIVAGESATMASEAAVLGVPAFFISTTGRGYTDEQESRYGLVRNFMPSEQESCITAILDIARRSREDITTDYQARRRRLLTERGDTTAWMVDFITTRGWEQLLSVIQK